jgi:hypothetical protein
MRDILAERLLAEVMKWTPEDVARERPDLQAIATFKYDEYQQFSPGMRFIESLAFWLAQFESDDERKCAYDFIRSRLVFISHAEMVHLVTITFSDFIRPLLISQAATHIGVSDRLLKRAADSIEYKVLLRQSLFLGLSDGAHTDLFRRSNPEISNEQVWQTYEISEEKAKDMLSKLKSDLEEWLGRQLVDSENKFRILFLLDDFSGSGLSYLRKEANEPDYAGKINKVLDKVHHEDSLNNLVDPKNLTICVVLYVATTQALLHIREFTKRWLLENGSKNECTVLAVQTLPESVRLHPEKDREFIDLLRKYFDESIIDEHYCKGKHDEPHLGFDHCALPLILSHNTPNNSIPLLWFDDQRNCRGLFPRVRRHVGEP